MPDAFGFRTPDEVSKELRERFMAQQIQMAQVGGQNPGARVGRALSALFAPTVRKMLDTRSARQAERKRLMAEGGMSEEEAKRVAKATVSPQFREVRQAAKMQEFAADGNDLIESFTSQGMDPIRATALAQLAVAQKLAAQGFDKEASQLRLTAQDALNKEMERVMGLDKLSADTDNTRANTLRTQQQMVTDSDTYVKIDDTGQAVDWMEVPEVDVEKRRQLEADGYIVAGPGSITNQLDDASIGGRKPIDRGTQEDIIGNLQMLGSLKAMRAAVPYAGFRGPLPKGLFNKWRGSLGFGPQEVVDASAVEDKMAADIQSIIKGIPSNYDASVFEKMIPRLGALKDARVYEAKLDLLETTAKEMVELTIGFHMGTEREVPRVILDAARALGVNVNEVDAWSEEQIARKDEIFKAHEDQTRQLSIAFDEEPEAPAAEERVIQLDGGAILVDGIKPRG